MVRRLMPKGKIHPSRDCQKPKLQMKQFAKKWKPEADCAAAGGGPFVGLRDARSLFVSVAFPRTPRWATFPPFQHASMYWRTPSKRQCFRQCFANKDNFQKFVFLAKRFSFNFFQFCIFIPVSLKPTHYTAETKMRTTQMVQCTFPVANKPYQGVLQVDGRHSRRFHRACGGQHCARSHVFPHFGLELCPLFF